MGKKSARKNIKINHFKQKNIEGFALAFSLIAVSFYLYLTPSFLNIELATYVTSATIGFIGIIGLMIETKRSQLVKIEGMKDLMIGLILFVLLLPIVIMDIWYLNIVALFLGILTFQSIFLGLIKIINQITSKGMPVFIRLLIFILNVIVIVLNIFEVIGF